MNFQATALGLVTVAVLAGQPAAAEVTEGQMIGTWKVTCENGPCRAFLTLQHNGADVVTWQLLGDRITKATSMLLTVPTGAALPPGVRVTISEASNFQVPFQVCDASGCTAAAVISPEMIAAIEGVKIAKVAYIPYGQQAAVSYEVPVDGFGQALKLMVQ